LISFPFTDYHINFLKDIKKNAQIKKNDILSYQKLSHNPSFILYQKLSLHELFYYFTNMSSSFSVYKTCR